MNLSTKPIAEILKQYTLIKKCEIGRVAIYTCRKTRRKRARMWNRMRMFSYNKN